MPVMDVEGDMTPAEASHRLLYNTVADSDGLVALPIDIKAVAWAIGLHPETRRLPDGVDGVLVRTGTGEPFRAVTDVCLPDNRRRLTLAYEMGRHIHRLRDMPDEGPLGIVASADATGDRWAEDFAATLLMPASIVRVMWASGMEPRDMAVRFGVPFHALAARLGGLGLL